MSMPMRINQAGADTLLVDQLDTSLAQLQQLQLEAATGRQINQPSANPAGTASALELNSQIGRLTAYGSNAADGQSRLDAADTTLASVTNALESVQTLLSQAANSSTEASGRAALAAQVQSIKTGLLANANASYDGMPLFSGSWASPAYANAAAGDYTYTGSPQAMTRTVGSAQLVAVSATGSSVFGTGPTSVFARLDQISADITSGNAAALSGADTTNLQSALDQVDLSRAQIGENTGQLQDIQTQTTAKVTTLQGNVASLVDVDEATAVTQLQLQNVQYQAALATIAKVIQPTLASFLG